MTPPQERRVNAQISCGN